MELPDDQKSKFDLTLQTLLHLSQLVSEAIEYRRLCYHNGRNAQALNNWFHTLDAIYIDLFPKLKEEEDNKIIQLYSKVTTMDIPILVSKRVEKNGKPIVVIDRAKYDNLFYDIRRLDKLIRYYLDKKNMRIASQESAMWAMGSD
jgi:hypothetical protein